MNQVTKKEEIEANPKKFKKTEEDKLRNRLGTLFKNEKRTNSKRQVTESKEKHKTPLTNGFQKSHLSNHVQNNTTEHQNPYGTKNFQNKQKTRTEHKSTNDKVKTPKKNNSKKVGTKKIKEKTSKPVGKGVAENKLSAKGKKRASTNVKVPSPKKKKIQTPLAKNVFHLNNGEQSCADWHNNYFIHTDSSNGEYSEDMDNYSDDFSEDEDSFTYEADELADLFNSSSNDEDYQLPDDVLEDLIIHKGTAKIRRFKAEDNVQFDNENKEAQIVEIMEQRSIVKSTVQPKQYELEELQKLSQKETNYKVIKPFEIPARLVTPDALKMLGEEEDETASNGSCPKLVPIVDDDGFQIYNSDINFDSSDSFDSFETLSDDDGSIMSIDVNSKYMHRNCSDDEKKKKHKKHFKLKADIISAENCTYVAPTQFSAETVENVNGWYQNDELPFAKIAKNSNMDVTATIISTTIFENNNELKKTVDFGPNAVEEEEAINPTADPQIPNAILGSNEIEVVGNTFHSIFCNAIDCNNVLVLVKHPIYIYGTVKLILIAGSIDVYGYSPKEGVEMEVFSPRGCSTVKVAATPNASTTKDKLHQELNKLEKHFSREDMRNILDNFSPQTDALLMIKRNAQRKRLVNFFKKYMNENVFPNMNSIRAERPFYASEFLLHCIINTESDKDLKVPPQWSQLQLQNESKMMFVGGKSVGKSTLLRYVLNRNLQKFKRVLLIDLDIGQTEMFVPQTISCFVISQPLLGPGFFLNRQPAKAYMIGHTNIVLCAHAYLRAVKKLLLYCHTHGEYSRLPWLINTMGYNKGFGLELIAVISELLRPTDIVQVQSNREINNFDIILQPALLAAVPRNIFIEFRLAEQHVPQYRLHLMHTAVPQDSRFMKDWDMGPKDLRYAMTLSRLSDALQGNAEWLTDCKPVCAPLDKLKVINMLSDYTTRDVLLNAIEANLVYLCNSEEGSDGDEVPLECFGIGVVRGIDYHLHQLFLLPAMPYTHISSVNCLALGEMPLPTSLFTNQGPKVKNVAPFVFNTVDDKASKSIKQIYHRPSEFLTGKHKNLR